MLLNAKNLPTKVVSAVFKTKLRPRFIGPFTVVAKKGLAYTLNLPRKLRTHPVFYVGLLKPYRDPSQVDWEALAPEVALPRIAASSSGCPAGPQGGRNHSQGSEDGFQPSSVSQSDPLDHEVVAPRASNYQPSGSDQGMKRSIFRPPPTLLDEQGNQQFHVEKILQRRRRSGQYQYLVKWRGYPESENSWEFEILLRQDCPYAVDVFERRAQGQIGTQDASQ